MTTAEVRALLARADARKLREEAGIRQLTVARAFGVPQYYISKWESGVQGPKCEAGFRWARFTAALERRVEITAELAEAA